MTARSWALAAAAVAALCLGATAQAQTPAPAALQALFPKGQPVCFARRYDAAHLRRHPDQSVTSVRLMRGFQEIRADDRRSGGDAVPIALIVTYRDSGARRFLGGAGCIAGEGGAITCHSDSCDGGSFPLRVEDSATILIGGPKGLSRFTVSGGCGDDGPARSLGRKPDDTAFRLTRAPIRECR